MTFSPVLPFLSASSGSKTILPDAAPGDAGIPLATGFTQVFGLILLCIKVSSISGFTLSSACSFVINPSLNISTDVFTNADGFIFAFLVWRMYSLFFSTVNSKS